MAGKLKAIVNISEIATALGNKAVGGHQMKNISVLKDAGIIIEDDNIVFVGTMSELVNSDYYKSLDKLEVIDAGARLVTAGYIDSHTHFVFGGDRANEYNMRLNGASYMDIMQAGGGIQASVLATRASSFEELYARGEAVLKNMMLLGITTVEGKSGYGLDEATEMKQLKVLSKLNQNYPVEVVSTYMGAHSVPPEMKGRARDYLESLKPAMKKIRQQDLAEFCDIFCEDKIFGIAETRDYLTYAKEIGFKIKLHADEIVDIGGAKLASEIGAYSADHLLMISDQSIDAMKKTGVVATLLPMTAFSLREHYAPARKLIDNDVAVALASDFNPGSCPSYYNPLIIALSTLNMAMSIEEVITAMTLNSAAAIDRADKVGSVEVGKKADLIIHNVDSYLDIPYSLGRTTVDTVLKNGNVIVKESSIV